MRKLKIVKNVIIEEVIPETFAEKLINMATERAEQDEYFDSLKGHEQLEIIYCELYGDISRYKSDGENIESWYIDIE